MNYYEILQVREDASDEVIKMAYKALVKKYHPDTFLGDKNIAEEMMKQINLAYEVLSNPQKRAEYDSFLMNKRNNENKGSSENNYSRSEQPKHKNINVYNYKKGLFIVLVVISILFLMLPLFDKNDIESIKDSVVMIVSYDEFDNVIGTGSGFCAYKSDYIITNYHVIEGANRIGFIIDDGSEYQINNVLIFDVKNDLAILENKSNELEPITIGSTSNLKAGDKVTAIGSPEGQLNTVSTGVISNADSEYEIRITTPISPGSSGGVLLNEKNEVIGVTFASYNSDEAQNINYAINVNFLKDIYRCLKNNSGILVTEHNYRENFVDFIDNDNESVYFRTNTKSVFNIFTSLIESYNIYEINGYNKCVVMRRITFDNKYMAERAYSKIEEANFHEIAVISIMNEYGAEQGGGIWQIIYPDDYVEAIDKWCFAYDRIVGDTAIIENEYGYTICYISAIYE